MAGQPAAYAAPPAPTNPLDYLGLRGTLKVGPTGLILWDGSNWTQTPLSWDSDTQVVTLPSGLLVMGGTELGSLHVTGTAQVDSGLTVAGGAALDSAAVSGDVAANNVAGSGTVSGAKLQRGAAAGFGSNRIHVFNTLLYTVPNNAWSDVNWFNEDLLDADDGTAWTVNNATFAARVSGVYALFGTAVFDPANTTGVRGLQIVSTGGTELDQAMQNAADFSGNYLSVGWVGYLPSGQTIRVRVFQNSGGALNILGHAVNNPFQAYFAQIA